jgi:predicted SAM-dependent methyltransferase
MSPFAETHSAVPRAGLSPSDVGSAGFSPYLRDQVRPEGRTPNAPSAPLARGPGFVGLNLGCGSRVVPGWINCDRTFRTVSFRLGRLLRLPRYRRFARLRCAGIDAKKPLPFRAESVHAIFEQHMLYAFEPEETQRLLAECHRVLRPGGVVRLNEDDLHAVAERYVRGDLDLVDYVNREAHVAIENIATPAEAFTAVFKKWSSLRWLYDAQSLAAHLHFAGFTAVELRGFHESRLPDIEALEKDNRDSVLGQIWIEALKRET